MNTTYYTYTPNVTVVPTYLPNTGFEPMSGEAWALAAVLLIAAAIVVLPRIKHAITSAGR